MPGRIGKTYPREAPLPQPAPGAAPSAATPHRRRRYAAIGGLIAALSALGLLGWLMLR